MWAHNLHFPPVIGLRADNRNSPISDPIDKHMFDDRSNPCLETRVSGVLHFY